MNEKQIEEMAKVIDIKQDYGLATESPPEQWLILDNMQLAAFLTDKGYQKKSETISEFKELVKQYLLDKGLYLTAVKNALEYAETNLIGE